METMAKALFGDGVEALVPSTMAVAGGEIDDSHLVYAYVQYYDPITKARQNSRIMRWKGDNSHLYKRGKVDEGWDSVNTVENRNTLKSITRALPHRFVREDRACNGGFEECLAGFVSHEYVKRVIPVMAERPEGKKGCYVYACLRGWMVVQARKWKEGEKNTVSYDIVEDILSLNEGSLLSVREQDNSNSFLVDLYGLMGHNSLCGRF